MKKLFVSMAALAALTGAQAATMTVSDTFGLSTTNWTDPISAAMFNPAAGTLTAANFTLTANIVQSLKAENTGAVADTLTPIAGAVITVRQGSTAIDSLTLSNTGSSFSATAFDGNSNYAGSSGIDFGSLTASGSKTFSLSAAQLALVIGTGTLDSVFNVRAVGDGAIDSDNGNLDSSISTQARYNLSIEYVYTPAVTAVPEPASLALLGLGLAGVALARRRKA